MDEKEIESLVKQLKAQGMDEEKIMDTYYEAFKKGEMSREDLEKLANHLGYELEDDFKNDPEPDPVEGKGAEGADKGELEEVKALEPGESKEEFKEKVEEVSKDDDEKAEWEEANKYFKV